MSMKPAVRPSITPEKFGQYRLREDTSLPVSCQTVACIFRFFAGAISPPVDTSPE